MYGAKCNKGHSLECKMCIRIVYGAKCNLEQFKVVKYNFSYNRNQKLFTLKKKKKKSDMKVGHVAPNNWPLHGGEITLFLHFFFLFKIFSQTKTSFSYHFSSSTQTLPSLSSTGSSILTLKNQDSWCHTRTSPSCQSITGRGDHHLSKWQSYGQGRRETWTRGGNGPPYFFFN